MSSAARAKLHRPRQRVFVFDSDALSKAVQGDREMAALIKTAPRLDIPIVTSALTTLEAGDPRESSRQALWNWTLSRIRIVHTDDQVIAMARDMLRTKPACMGTSTPSTPFWRLWPDGKPRKELRQPSSPPTPTT